MFGYDDEPEFDTYSEYFFGGERSSDRLYKTHKIMTDRGVLYMYEDEQTGILTTNPINYEKSL